MLVILLEWERAVYNFPSDCYKSEAKTPTSGGTGSCPGALVATRAVGGLEGRCTNQLEAWPWFCLPLPSLRVPGAWESPDCPICKLQSRLSASTSEIKAPSSCLAPPEPGLSSVQTLWQQGPIAGVTFCSAVRSEEGSENVQPRKGKKEKGTHNNNSLFQPSGGRKFGHSSEKLPVCVIWGRERLTGRVCPCVLLQQPFGAGNSWWRTP